MKNALVFLVTGWAMIVAGQGPPIQLGTRQPSTEKVASSESVVPNGVRFSVRMRSAVSSSQAKAGDSVNLELLDDVKDSNDLVLVPRKAKLSAHVVGARAYTKDLDARLSILVDRAEWEGHSVQLTGIIAAVPHVWGLEPTWAGPGGPIGRPTTIGDSNHPIVVDPPPTAPANKAGLPPFRVAIEGVEIGYLPESRVSVLVSKTHNIDLHKGTVLEFRQHRPHGLFTGPSSQNPVIPSASQSDTAH